MGVFDRLSAEGLDAVHEASMHIVESVGVRLNHERAQALVAEHGGTVDDDGLATLPQALVERCLEGVPSEFTLHARNPDNDVTVGGGGEPVRAPGYGPSHVLTPDGRRESTLADYETLLKLAQTEDVITCTGYNVCDPTDVHRSVKHVEMFERALRLTDKPVMGSTYGETRAGTCLEMLGIAVGDSALGRPYMAGLVNTAPPRSIEREMLGALLTYAEHGQPPIVSSFTMAGASGPESLPASMAQANAENLVAITLTQLVNPGTPVVYGVPSAAIDACYGSLSVGSPESALFVSFAGQMGEYYDIPSRAGGGLTDAKVVDYQSGFESMFLQAVTAFAGIDFVLHAAGILGSYSTISPEKFVLDCEGLRCLDRFREGYAIDAERFALDRIEDVDPAGHFLDGSPGPTDGYHPELADKRSYGDWADDGGTSAFERGHERVRNRLDAYERPELDADVASELEAYVDSKRASI